MASRMPGCLFDRGSVRHASGKRRNEHGVAAFLLGDQVDLIGISLPGFAHGPNYATLIAI